MWDSRTSSNDVEENLGGGGGQASFRREGDKLDGWEGGIKLRGRRGVVVERSVLALDDVGDAMGYCVAEEEDVTRRG
jgi:hypothetical protein